MSATGHKLSPENEVWGLTADQVRHHAFCVDKSSLLLTSRTMYQGICIPESNLSWSRYAAKGFSSSHGKPGSTAKEDKEGHWLKKKPLK